MAPTFEYWGVTGISAHGVSTGGNYDVYNIRKRETKQQRIARIAKQRMLASWLTYDQRTMNVIQVKQICKPQHQINQLLC